MKDTLNKNKISIAIICLWIGFVGAISFMEAWLKFTATGVTLPIGLAIGSLVFYALNKVEIVLAVLLLIPIFTDKRDIPSKKHLYKLAIPILILLAQTVYLLPILDERAQLIIQGKNVAESKIHIIYIALEIIKITTLITVGIQIVRKKECKE